MKRFSMPTIFTDYVRSLDPSGEPEPASFDRLWKALRGVLRSEVKRRGLWDSSPVLLGVHGWGSSWWSGDGGGRSSDALDELAADCYTFVFIDRLRSLRSHLAHKLNIDGLVFRCVRNFLHDVQKRQDPLGFRVFSLVKAALRGLAEAGGLHRLSGDGKIGNETVFGFRQGATPARDSASCLKGIVRSWSHDLAGDLVAGRATGEDPVVSRLARRILSLSDHGVEAFSTADLVDPLKAEVRARWAAFFEETEGERAFEDLGAGLTEVVRLVRPDRGYEDRESFDRLAACVTLGVDGIEDGRTRRYLGSLWRFLRSFAVESGVVGSLAGAGRLPSRRKLARHLRIPRDRLPELYATLRQLVTDCFQARSGQAKLGRPEVIPDRNRTRPLTAAGPRTRRKHGRPATWPRAADR